MYVPPPYEAVWDCMQAFFDLLREEPEPSVRVVLGHFVFAYIHPYMDGNGRMGRFFYERDARRGRVPLDQYPTGKAKRLYGDVGKRER